MSYSENSIEISDEELREHFRTSHDDGSKVPMTTITIWVPVEWKKMFDAKQAKTKKCWVRDFKRLLYRALTMS